MRRSTLQRPSPLLAASIIPTFLLSLTSFIQPTLANPYPRDELHDTLGHGFLMDRGCATYCGVDNQYCCSDDQVCTTSDSIAGCTDTANGGGYAVYTTTWTETDTFTSTISSYYAATTATDGATCTPKSGSGQVACGSICCASWQYCAYEDQCSANTGSVATTTAAGGGGSGGSGTSYTTIITSGSTITTPYSAPYRVTGSETTSNTAFAESSTSTSSVNGTAAVSTGGSHLSGGAVAGIVIGTIAGVALLLAICACCIMRGLWHGLLAIFGLGPRKRRRSRSRGRETIIIEEERYARHGGVPGAAGAAGRRERHDSWFAARPERPRADSRRISQTEKRRESHNTNDAGWWGAGALGTMGAMLGLRRDRKRREQQQQREKRASRPRNDVSSSYFSDSYTASSPSEFSSDYTYSSVYTRPAQAQAAHARDVRPEPAVGHASRVKAEYYKSNVPPDYAVSASSGGRTRDTGRSRGTESTRRSRDRSRRR